MTAWYVARVDPPQRTGPLASSFSSKRPRVTHSITCKHTVFFFLWIRLIRLNFFDPNLGNYRSCNYSNWIIHLHGLFCHRLVIGSAGTPLQKRRSQEAPDQWWRTYLRCWHVWSCQWPQAHPHAEVLQRCMCLKTMHWRNLRKLRGSLSAKSCCFKEPKLGTLYLFYLVKNFK